MFLQFTGDDSGEDDEDIPTRSVAASVLAVSPIALAQHGGGCGGCGGGPFGGGGGHFGGGGGHLAYPAVEGTSIHPVVEAGFSGGFMDLGLALVRRASVRDISAGDSSAIGMSACSLSAAPAGFGVMIHARGIRRGGGIIAAITDAGRKS